MKRFAELFDALDRTTSTNAKVAALAGYLREAPPGDAAWALYFLTGRRLKRLLPARLLHNWTLELTSLPEWLVQECYASVGDFAEAIALLLDGDVPGPKGPDQPPRGSGLPVQAGLFDDPPAPFEAHVEDVSLQQWIEARILPLAALDDSERRRRVVTWWSRLERRQLFLLNKLLTGEFRVGVSQTLVVRAVAQIAGLAPAIIEHRLMGVWEPSGGAFSDLILPEGTLDGLSRPYPFCLASPLTEGVASLGSRAEWLAEWKWDGIRAQLIHRGDEVFLWSRGEEILTARFPEIAAAGLALPAGTVLDGEILAYADRVPRPFADLQRRIGRERRVREVAEDVPVVFLAFDLLEDGGEDIRQHALSDRRTRLLRLVEHAVASGAAVAGEESVLRASEDLVAPDWEVLGALRMQSRARHVEGLMLKRWSSPYRPGRRRGDWWKWKIEPFTTDCVLIYAQPGTGRRASLFTDYTFGVWDEGQLVPVAKAYSGLTDVEIDELDRWIRRHTVERFGPVSAVEPVLVFELGFERIAASTRHKSGIALRFPRMLRWRRDKTADEADTLATLQTMVRRES